MIDPTAIIDPSAKIAENVEIGPWTLVGPDVEIDEGCVISSHVVIKGPTKIGRNNRIFQFSTIGDETPDLKYNGEPTRLVIGDNNVIREGVTIHRGTIQDRSETTIGNDNLLMAYVHIGHDSVVGNNTILINNASLAGHVIVDDWAIISGYSLIHQFCRIGAHSFVGMGSGIAKDVPAYTTVQGTPADAKGINSEGLRRRGYSKESISAIKKAYKIIYRQGLTVEEALVQLRILAEDAPEVNVYIESLESSTRGIVR
ncbi:Acyl-[acyl-carrier-protein]--UDP-N-acetylglucosamine O-acyltransferase [Sinobacterium norvegicum]|uniref:Acyl-[acyl-carrier-protein]--UDP-N-acetylglucosamine O-acyltransferase n=1 Tax=Sinobacterium norvegicum TaxID=1641715 RepID=A0ABM9ABW8_9GAMM|nr:acyl-ACP--UDP-N-acetylglucosamine O-acyltransferase [Sinobacterium norvegicum]CAH0990701.1 Acyl-[acyl-carrier-protein]--UDP-N-acetylglucosamine O-acyltransferase [Sinobacterium norvegicum]